MMSYPPKVRAAYTTQIWEMGVLLHCLFTCKFPLFGKNKNPVDTPDQIKQSSISMGIMNSFNLNNTDLLHCLAYGHDHLYFLKNMVESMLQVDPSQRPSASVLLNRLEDFKKQFYR
jgi:serine/threonine protein kinase